jgi:hypothetical protein
LPDGLDNLATHNLITFKSHHEALDDWTLKELTGHYVNYRKQVSPSPDNLLPEEEFHLYAVCSRFPHNLAGSANWREVQAGVYECVRGSDAIRVVVLGQLPQTENNAPLHLLSAKPSLIEFGATHYKQHSPRTSTLIYRVFEGLEQERIAMPYTMEDFTREFVMEHFYQLPEEMRRRALRRLSPEERLEGLSPEERLEGLSPEEIERCLSRRKQQPRSRKRRKNG